VSDPLSYLFGLEQFGIKFGLDNMLAIVERLGHPERAFRTIHIAGTNGKGSVTAMIDQALIADGYRSARYTSPHLTRLEERATKASLRLLVSRAPERAPWIEVYARKSPRI